MARSIFDEIASVPAARCFDVLAKARAGSPVASVNADVFCAHTHAEMAEIIRALLELPGAVQGCIVEAGCFKGGSTVKLSIAAKLVGRKLVVFDLFEGLPDSAERHGKTIFGERTGFVAGLYAGALEEVRANVEHFGELEVCEFRKGWFDDTMPHFAEPVVAAFIDVDLASSTRTCIQYLYPLLVPGGVIFSHDGHLPLCIEVFCDEDSLGTVGGPLPVIEGLGKRNSFRSSSLCSSMSSALDQVSRVEILSDDGFASGAQKFCQARRDLSLGERLGIRTQVVGRSQLSACAGAPSLENGRHVVGTLLQREPADQGHRDPAPRTHARPA